MSSAQDWFAELLWYQGGWVGLLVILLMVFALYKLSKFTVVISVPILFMLSLEYLDRISGTSDFMWSFFICWVAIIVLLFDLITNLKGKK